MSGASDEAERYFHIDWFREPQSDREAKIRAALLRRQVAKVSENPFGAALYLREQIGYRFTEVDKCANDFREAWSVVESACDSLRRTAKRREIEEVIREVDRV